MGDERGFFGFDNLIKVMLSHFILKNKLLVSSVQTTTLLSHLSNSFLDILKLIIQLSIRSIKQSEVLLLLLNLFLSNLNLSIELFCLFLRPFSLSTRHLPVHLLDLVVGVVLEFLLALRFDLEFVDGCL